jgi:hypothetical protein
MSLFALLAVLTARPLAAEVPTTCAVRVEFASYAVGIDQPALLRVQALLRRDHAVRAVAAERWGREGEVTLCVHLRRRGDVRRVFTRVKAALPAKPRGPIRVEAQNGLRFEAQSGETRQTAS